jgi:hypothetical protein
MPIISLALSPWPRSTEARDGTICAHPCSYDMQDPPIRRPWNPRLFALSFASALVCALVVGLVTDRFVDGLLAWLGVGVQWACGAAVGIR